MEQVNNLKERVKVSPVDPKYMIDNWEIALGYLKEAIESSSGRITPDDILDNIRSGAIMPMLVWDPDTSHIYAIVLGEQFVYPRRRVFSLTLAGGSDLSVWAHLYPAFKEIARQVGCDQIEVVGRAGWIKFLPGAHETYRCFVEDLQVIPDEQ